MSPLKNRADSWAISWPSRLSLRSIRALLMVMAPMFASVCEVGRLFGRLNPADDAMGLASGTNGGHADGGLAVQRRWQAKFGAVL